MLTTTIVRIVEYCVRNARGVAIGFLLVGLAAGLYSASHFRINSDVNDLLSNDLAWRKREKAFEQAFGRMHMLYAVVEAPTPELAAQASVALTERLAADKAHFSDVVFIAGLPFFAQNGLLFLTPEALRETLTGLEQGAPLIQDLASDMSLVGLVAGLEDGLIGVSSGRIKLDGMAGLMDSVSTTVEAANAGRPAFFSWRVATQGRPATPGELRGVIQLRPTLDYSSVQPGLAASTKLREIAAEVLPAYEAQVRLTGPVAMADEEFGTIKEHAARDGLITAAVVLFILWRALRSGRLILAVAINLTVGLAITAALGLAMIGSFNLISVYFAVLFVGIGVDFGIQFSVRYRAERHEIDDLPTAISRAALYFGAPLTLAGLATAAGFMSFLPTDYKGVSELGQIAGVGMLVAFAVSVTFLPALIALFNPPGEPEPLGYAQLAPVDRFMARHRVAIIAGTALVVVGGLPLLYWLKFDFNPINLRDARTESVATYLELARDPDNGVYAIQAIAPTLEQADQTAAQVVKLPEVAEARTLSSFIPADQAQKLPLIAKAAVTLLPALEPKAPAPPPNDADMIEAVKEAADRLVEAADAPHNSDQKTGGGAARRLAAALQALAAAPPEKREAARAALVDPLAFDFGGLRKALRAQEVTRASLPPELVRDWIAPSGGARLSITPKDNSGDPNALRAFARAVLKVEPEAILGPVSVLEAGDTVVRAFVEAGALALVSIAVILLLVLKKPRDVALTLIPLALAGVVTMEIMVLIGMPLNFANIIALPLLLGVGVAFKIYYIMAWRQGQTDLLQTSLTRAVIFSAATTATAFGSLWFSSHPGTSSMGKLLALSLVCTLAAAVLFQPILMGKPRKAERPENV
ncbi:MMPL family transporter [Rhodoblastus sp.]|uniref:hopanoid transporter HpnN n=1 Tax=Rhodoblastus sp. TaxID=1962975 RepID=UPI0035AEAE68